MTVKAIPTRVLETKATLGETTHCTWEVQLYDDDANTVITKLNVDLFIADIKASKVAYNNHLKARTVQDAAQAGYSINTNDVIIL